jgi:hypothetical protein
MSMPPLLGVYICDRYAAMSLRCRKDGQEQVPVTSLIAMSSLFSN